MKGCLSLSSCPRVWSLNSAILHKYSHNLISSFYWLGQAAGWERRWKQKANIACDGVTDWFKQSLISKCLTAFLGQLLWFERAQQQCCLASVFSVPKLLDVRSHVFQYSSIVTVLCQVNPHLRKNWRNRPGGYPPASSQIPTRPVVQILSYCQLSEVIPSPKPQPDKNPATTNSNESLIYLWTLRKDPMKRGGYVWLTVPLLLSQRVNLCSLSSFVCVYVSHLFAPLKLILPLATTSSLLSL